MTITAAELAEFTLARQHPVTRDWVDDETRLQLLTEMHEDPDILLANSLEIAELRTERFAPGQPVESMLNHWLPAGDVHAMFSMRFEGGDTTKPFVDATSMSRNPLPEDLPALAATAKEVYGMHNPRDLRLWSVDPEIPGTEPDRRFLAAPIRELRPTDVPPGLALRQTITVDHYDEAKQAYADVDADHPHHVEEAGIQDREDLQEAADEGLLYDITVNDEWAGYAAAIIKPEDSLGLPAYVVRELILTKNHRGHGYGRHLSHLLASALPDPTRIYIGTIHAANQGAQQAARTAGRQDIGGWVTLPLDQD